MKLGWYTSHLMLNNNQSIDTIYCGCHGYEQFRKLGHQKIVDEENWIYIKSMLNLILHSTKCTCYKKILIFYSKNDIHEKCVCVVFISTFNNISVVSWRSVYLAKETGVPGKNYQPAASHGQTLSHKFLIYFICFKSNFMCIWNFTINR